MKHLFLLAICLSIALPATADEDRRSVSVTGAASDAPFTFTDGPTGLGTVTVDQQVAPAGAVLEEKAWESLGVYNIAGGSLHVELSEIPAPVIVAIRWVVPSSTAIRVLASRGSKTARRPATSINLRGKRSLNPIS